MGYTKEQLLAHLQELQIDFVSYNHPIVLTVEAQAKYVGHLGGGLSKNLLLKDKKHRFYIVSALAGTKVDLKVLSQRLGLGKGGLRMAPEEALQELLQVPLGAVTPFALINESARTVSLLLDQGFRAKGCCFFHPLSNDMTISLSSQDLDKFLISIGRQPPYVDLEATPLVGKDQPPDLATLVPSLVPVLPNPAEKEVLSQHPGDNHAPIEIKSTELTAILADEMGLGKTIQAITYLTLPKHLDNDPGPHLIVCLAFVLENWERELRKWCPSFSILQYHGAGRTAYSKELNSLAKSGLPPPFNVLLVCYSLFERHSAQQKDDRKALKRWRWSCVLMDEAHVLKDKNSYRWKNLMSVAQNAQQRLMLTGTPLQNDLHELWSLLEFMMPDIFATGDVDLKKLLNSEDMVLIARIKSILGPFILRRLKSDVMQQLVPKIQEVKYVFMETEQAEAYKEAIDEYRTASQARLAKLAGVTTSNAAAMFPKRQVSNYFVQFRKIANHLLLVRRIYSDEDVVRFARMLHPKGAFGFECTLDRVIEELKGYNDFAIHRLLVYYYGITARGALSEEHVLLSAKCKALAELLPSLKERGHRVLIFSQWTAMLDILEWALDVIGVTYLRLDGSTQVTERQTIVDTFNNDPSIFACLLSTRAGGQGLNLIGADTVVIHDMDFNPQMDRQAEDRCHRIGQTKPVTIYRLVTKGTVDENVYEIAKRKLILDAAVLENGMDLENENALSEKTMGEILSALLLGGLEIEFTLLSTLVDYLS